MVPYITLFDDCANKRKFDVLEKVHFIQTVLLDLKSNVLFILDYVVKQRMELAGKKALSFFNFMKNLIFFENKLYSFPGNGSSLDSWTFRF
jgi:hypothetical protein